MFTHLEANELLPDASHLSINKFVLIANNFCRIPYLIKIKQINS